MQPNTFGAIEAAVAAQVAAEKATRNIRAAKTALVLGKTARDAFFSVLAMRLPCEPAAPENGVGTAATDGKRIVYSPEFIAGLSVPETIGVIAHEVMHCASMHHARMGTRAMRKWNIACDLAINGVLQQAGFALPQGGLFPGVGKYAALPVGLSAEAYYEALPDDPDDPDGGATGSDPGGCGGVLAPADQAQGREQEADWKAAVAQAQSVAKGRGELPAGLVRTCDAALHEPLDWKSLLARFVQRAAKTDYSWSPPNRRLVHAGIYLPSIDGATLGTVVVAVDTSGSIGQDVLGKFAAEIEGILSAYEVQLVILYHDSAVAHEQRWEPSDGPLVLEPRGGGGTDHVPVFDRVEADGEATCLICLTDGYTRFPDSASVPTMWAMTTDVEPPFGECVRVA